MRRSLVFSTILSLCFTNVVMATITEWGPATTGFTIEDGIHTITITAPGSYFFRAITDDEPDYIQLITVDSGIASGTVNITVAYDSNGGIGGKNE